MEACACTPVMPFNKVPLQERLARLLHTVVPLPATILGVACLFCSCPLSIWSCQLCKSIKRAWSEPSLQRSEHTSTPAHVAVPGPHDEGLSQYHKKEVASQAPAKVCMLHSNHDWAQLAEPNTGLRQGPPQQRHHIMTLAVELGVCLTIIFKLESWL